MKIKFKILLCALFPLFIALILVFQFVQAKKNDSKSALTMTNNIILMSDSLQATIEIQKERGLSSMYVSGASNKVDFENQKNKTNDKIKILFDSLKKAEIDSKAVTNVSFIEDELKKVRDNVSYKKSRELILKEYTSIIRKIMLLNKAAIEGKTSFGLGKQMTNIVLLSEALEYAGLLRGTVAGILSDNKNTSQQTISDIIYLNAAISLNLQNPALILSSEGKENLKNLLNDDSWKNVQSNYLKIIDKTSPEQNNLSGKIFLEFMSDIRYKITEIASQEAIRLIQKSNEIAKKAKKSVQVTIISVSIATIILLFIIIITASRITKPIIITVETLKGIAEGEGDLTKSINIQNKDETGELAHWFNKFVQSLRKIILNISRESASLTDSSKNLLNISTHISASTEEINVQSTTVAAASEEASTNIVNMSQSANQLSSSVNSIASAIEEMNASLQEVARNVQKEAEIAKNANDQAKNTKLRMEKLGMSAKEIGKVIEVINDIADQTNLLALNATIEAASVGEAGKGFAVVANEVKELSKQTALSTQEISKQVEEMQENTNNAIKAIEQITEIIGEINNVSQTLVSVVEEQSTTINEISKNITEASLSSNEIAGNIKESAKGLTEISSNIHGMSDASAENTKGIKQIEENSKTLSILAENLQKIVNLFKV